MTIRRTAVLLLAASSATAMADAISIPMDSLSPAGYLSVPPAPFPMTLDVVNEAPRTYVKVGSINANGSTFSGPTVDFSVYSGSDVDASAAGATLELDVRYVQIGNGENGEQPYEDAHTMFDIILHSANGESWTWTDAFDNPQPFGDWHHLSLDLGDTAGNPAFDLTQVESMQLRGFNNRFVGADYIGLDNLVITPEPASMALLGLGLLGLRRRS